MIYILATPSRLELAVLMNFVRVPITAHMSSQRTIRVSAFLRTSVLGAGRKKLREEGRERAKRQRESVSHHSATLIIYYTKITLNTLIVNEISVIYK